jgi:hypothetical protein
MLELSVYREDNFVHALHVSQLIPATHYKVDLIRCQVILIESVLPDSVCPHQVSGRPDIRTFTAGLVRSSIEVCVCSHQVSVVPDQLYLSGLPDSVYECVNQVSSIPDQVYLAGLPDSEWLALVFQSVPCSTIVRCVE